MPDATLMNGRQVSSRATAGPTHGLVFILLEGMVAFAPALQRWPLVWLVPLAAYAILVALVPALRSSFHPWRFGRISLTAVVATLVLAVGSCSVLAAFQSCRHPDLSGFRGLIPVSTLGGVLMAGALFSCLNALLEEIIFRGILFDALEPEWGGGVAVAMTAFLFGCGHLRGYPPGLPGAALAGFYGLCLGWLRLVTRGIGLPVVAHIAADATIFVILAEAGGL